MKQSWMQCSLSFSFSGQRPTRFSFGKDQKRSASIHAILINANQLHIPVDRPSCQSHPIKQTLLSAYQHADTS